MQEQISIENQFSFYEKKSNDVFKRALADLKAEYEAKDKEIFHSKWRKNQGYIPHGTRTRTITTIFGDLTYSRHLYKHWDKYKYRYVYISDLALGIKKYQSITNHL